MKLGPYEILEGIGQGAAGAVFKARSAEGRLVALKVLKRLAPDAVARFERERRIHSALGEGEGFVPLIDSGESPRGPYLVMPFIPGGTLRARLAWRGRLPVDEAVALVRELSTALGLAHSLGIAHRDMKPENVLYTPEGAPLIADLGLAKHFISSAPDGMSQTGSALGTVGYAAPEQLSDAKSVGPQADVFALGAILYECLAGTPPFRGETALEVAFKVTEGKYDPLVSKREDTPAWLVRVVTQALAKAPQDRFANGTLLAAALESAEWGPPKRVAPPRAVKRVVPEGETPDLDVPPTVTVKTEALDESGRTLRVEVPWVVGETMPKLKASPAPQPREESRVAPPSSRRGRLLIAALVILAMGLLAWLVSR